MIGLYESLPICQRKKSTHANISVTSDHCRQWMIFYEMFLLFWSTHIVLLHHRVHRCQVNKFYTTFHSLNLLFIDSISNNRIILFRHYSCGRCSHKTAETTASRWAQNILRWCEARSNLFQFGNGCAKFQITKRKIESTSRYNLISFLLYSNENIDISSVLTSE